MNWITVTGITKDKHWRKVAKWLNLDELRFPIHGRVLNETDDDGRNLIEVPGRGAVSPVYFETERLC